MTKGLFWCSWDSRWSSVTSGISQGCVLAPSPFIIYINDLDVDLVSVSKVCSGKLLEFIFAGSKGSRSVRKKGVMIVKEVERRIMLEIWGRFHYSSFPIQECSRVANDYLFILHKQVCYKKTFLLREF